MSIKRLAPVGLAFLVAGCGAIGAIGVKPREAAPTQRVEATELPPLLPPSERDPFYPDEEYDVAERAPGTFDPRAGTQGGADAATGFSPETRSEAAGAAGQVELGRTDLLGGWTLSGGNDTCQLFMTLTTWTGGYRASTRGCSSQTLQSIAAWNLSGNQVVLAAAGGAPVARLYPSGHNRFDGQTEDAGGPISFHR